MHSWNVRTLCEHHGHEGCKEPQGSWDPHTVHSQYKLSDCQTGEGGSEGYLQ